MTKELTNKVGEIVAGMNDIIAPTLATQAAPPLGAQNMGIEGEYEKGRDDLSQWLNELLELDPNINRDQVRTSEEDAIQRDKRDAHRRTRKVIQEQLSTI
ncbi:hypothetical protein FRB91_007639 [Serendipita sp. 411]|nr:hypothetical protein FRC15_007672 [Serendipita sp. 397]KAG8792782.1 hypothetical protein FRC16_011267 [Serendipita sp. 398]KAG8807012.1 hypothetical protein FRC19_006920 [Serendipita sp. 401]KAG8809320.1 hypothetical protein FRC18_004608 [Serendipita sp. 400]KAG8834890.1 hypothetical protein FRC20_007380 [Serendipita sp. 405]KAG8838393.1 hypothetical protein FRB91_007639 [Serendipita sp. 411]KAG9022056.1 hypothetical protein FS842_006342 [Serendipita sp. 407]